MQETWVRSLGQEDTVEKEIATHSSILAWRIPWTEEPGRFPVRGVTRVRNNLATKPPPPYVYTGFPGSASGKGPAFQCRRLMSLGFNPWVRKIPWKRKWQPTPVFLPSKTYGQRNW